MQRGCYQLLSGAGLTLDQYRPLEGATKFIVVTN